MHIGSVVGVGVLLGALSLGGGLGCDRNIEPFTDDAVAEPDLGRIFPEAAQGDQGMAPIMPGPGESGGAPAPPQARSGSGEAMRGTLRVAPALAGSVPEGAILFVIARMGPSGPPTAVLRVPDPTFPMSFAIGPEHLMIEQMPFQGPFAITVRVDADGNAMTRNPGDLQGAALTPHSPGDSGIAIEIDEVL